MICVYLLFTKKNYYVFYNNVDFFVNKSLNNSFCYIFYRKRNHVFNYYELINRKKSEITFNTKRISSNNKC